MTLAGAALAWRFMRTAGPSASPSITRATAVPLTASPGWEGSPTLSPDGTQVAFEWTGTRGDPDIYVKLVGDGEPVRLTNDPRWELGPAWSPDGRRVAFLREPLGTGAAGVHPDYRDLMVVPALGGTVRQIMPLTVFTAPLEHRGMNWMAWTPDGKWLAVGALINGKAGLWLVEVDGPGRRRVTEPPPGHVDHSPRVSADGRRVAFARAGPTSAGVLLVLPLGPDLTPDGSPREIVDPTPGYVGAVAWGADQAVALGLVTLAGAALAWRFTRTAGTPTPTSNIGAAATPVTAGERTPSVRSIAVLPFEDLSAGQGDVVYADGLTEALITELSTLGGLDKVIGRQSVARFRAAPIPLREAARALDVDAIVTASVLRSAGRLRVTARLVDGATERHLWAATYERPDGEVLLIQRQVVEAIAGAIQLALGPEAIARMPKAWAVGAPAFDAYIAGRRAANAGLSNLVEAIGHFEKATALDPEFAAAHAALADALWHGSMFGIPARDAYTRGKAAAARAIELDPNLGEAHAARGLLALHADWDWASADASLGRALALSPNSPVVRVARTHVLVLAARYAEAIDEARRSVELEPSSYYASGNLAWATFHARRYEESIERWRVAGRLGRDPIDQGLAVIALANAGRADEMRTSCPPAVTGSLAWRCAQGHALLGHTAPARLLLAKAPANSGLLALAEVHAALADATGAVRVLERAYDAHDSAVLFMNAPAFDPVRHDPAFRRLQRRMNYPALAEGTGRTNPAAK